MAEQWQGTGAHRLAEPESTYGPLSLGTWLASWSLARSQDGNGRRNAGVKCCAAVVRRGGSSLVLLANVFLSSSS
ncbi:hypothetical protein GGH94_004401 [Coemansia aciculifera]|uniref:Uncharacterized protein n=1 Tax=Coemansia aciculifera TaxID=417176 RepID=A0A9W8M448_9FUNG|nr:hypothetical protein GGH94_004401 [Coemansia aciculifera]